MQFTYLLSSGTWALSQGLAHFEHKGTTHMHNASHSSLHGHVIV